MQVGIQTQFLLCAVDDTPVSLCIYIGVQLVALRAVVFIVRVQLGRIDRVMHINDGAKVVADIVISRHTYLRINIFRYILGRKHYACEMVIQELAIDSIGFLHSHGIRHTCLSIIHIYIVW